MLSINPEFVIFTGPMFGGKTTRLLASLERANYQKKSIALFKPKKDNRYSFDKVMCHTGLSWDAYSITSGSDILVFSKNANIIAVDEAFMIPGCADVLIQLFKQGKSIYVSSIQLSASGEPFEEMTKMFPWATKVEVCSAVCSVSSNDAYYTVAIADKSSEIQVGGSETYEPRSFSCSNIPVQEN